MKVLQVNVDDMFSGGVFALIKNIVANNNQNIKIDIASMEPFQNQTNIDYLKSFGCDVYNICGKCNKFKKQFVARRNLKVFLEKHKYDCVHIHSDVANKLYFFGKAAKAAGVKKIIIHSHASGVDGKYRFLKKLIHFVYRRLLKRLKVTYVACSDKAASWMYPNIPFKEVIILNNGVDLGKFSYDEIKRKEMREKLRVTDEIVVTNIGRFSYQKNHKFIIKIAQLLKFNNINARILLVGQGPNEEKIKNLCARKGLGKYISFMGASNEIAELLCASDIFILPSKFEGLPIVGVEAQATGLPCIFSDKITKQAKLIGDVAYLKINNGCQEKWYNQILEFALLERRGATVNFNDLNFSINDTIDRLFKLYNE